MEFRRIAFVSTVFVAGVLVAGCDTPKEVFKDTPSYANRVASPDALSSSVRNMVVTSDTKPLNFNKITYTISANVIEGGAPTTHATDFTIENAGNTFAREILVFHRNGVESGQGIGLTYRGLLWLYEIDINPNAVKMPFARNAESITHMDTAFDQPTLSYTFRWHSENPRILTTNRSMSCSFVKTYAGSSLSAGIEGNAREYNCNFYNDNGVQDQQKTYAYLEKYGLAIETHVAQVNEHIDWTITNFKVE
jgi:hypothetical protein